MTGNQFSTFVVYLFVCFLSTASVADQSTPRGEVLKINGEVEIINLKGETRVIKNTGEALHEMDTIVTKKGARVVVQFDDGALSVLDEKSRLRVEKSSWFSYLGGKVYFTFKKVFGEPRHVRTRAATIGVRGTTFIISDAGEQAESVALKEGLLQIESTGPVFEIHKNVLDDFEQFKVEQQQAKAALKREFEQYRQQTQHDFIEYQHEFTLQPNRVISLSGYRVDEAGMTAADEKDFESFESEAEDLINTFRTKVDKVKSEQNSDAEKATKFDG